MTRPFSSGLPVTSRRSALPLVTALMLAAAAGSCDKVDSAQSTLDAANVKLESMASAGSNVVSPVKWRKDEYGKLVTNLKPIADGSEGTQSQAANVLLARAKAGLAEMSAKDAGEQEQTFLSQVTIARAQLDQWISQHSTAASLNAYDPAKDLADLDKQVADKFAEAAKYQSDKSKQEAVVSEINGRADKARQAAKKERDREAGIRKQAEGMSQTAREQVITQAVEASRAADALERQAAELSAEAAREAPKVDEIANIVDRLQKQVESLKKAKESIQSRAAAAHEHSQQASGEASAVGEKMGVTLRGIEGIRTSATGPATEAVSRYKEAVAASKKAAMSPVRESKVAAVAAQAGYQQCIGDVLATKARGLAVYASLLNTAAAATPALPGAAEYASKAKAIEAEFKTASDEAEAAYVEAKSNYESAGKAGATGDVKARIDAVVKALQDLHDLRTKPAQAKPEESKPEGEKAAEAKPAAKEGEQAAALSAEDSKSVEAEVRAALKDIQAGMKGDATEQLLAHFDYSNETERSLVEGAIPLKKASEALATAVQAKYGKSLGELAKESQAEAVKANPMLPMLLGALSKKDAISGAEADADKVTVKATSKTTAEVSMEDTPGSTKLVKKDGVWKITGVAAMMGGPMASQMAPMFKSFTETMASVTDGITKGTYADADAMLTDLSGKLMSAMGGMGGGMPGRGGPKPKPGAGKPTGQTPPPGGG